MPSKKSELIVKYQKDLREKFNVEPDMELLGKVTDGLGPSIYNRDSSTVSGSDIKELERVKNNFLIKKLGLADSPELMEAINAVMKEYGTSVRTKYRAVVYYQLTRHFGREGEYN
ncbi:DUF2853 family protein [Lentiprolixibacter aurantiacus]|uniref:DUF2853 family protein n=1 Tax=Lentiprolixibacter aurantiacus TaxID=2993939 RepID=A0AAE3MLM0_9FLAO|nr:DUF2853 family protein [Lentiprolixibacter aurantiacus]MCX2719438.1 DUF2853 family protein [Lentiprolixibacter aurantiacus]